MSCEVVNNIIFFDSDFNKILDNEIIQVIKLCDTIYFNNYYNIDLCLEKENKYNYHYYNYKNKSKFNQ